MPSFDPSSFWPRAIILVDMNAFFASIEQYDFPELRGRPVAVTNGQQGSCIITSSYEARAHGIKTGMRLREGRRLCPDLIQCPARPKRYVQVSRSIMEALADFTPDMEVFSVDEAFLDITHCQRLLGRPVDVARQVQARVHEVSGLLCSVGLSGDKTTAKFAAKLQKPNGFTVIPPWESKQRLQNVPVTELCGIAHGIGSFLARYGVRVCGDIEKLPISILGKRFGNLGRRIWYMCQGADPDPVHLDVVPAKSMGHGKVMPPRTKDRKTILMYLQHMSEKVAARLRRHEMQAQLFYVGVRSYDCGWLGDKTKLAMPTNDGREIYRLCKKIFNYYWFDDPVCQVQVTALDPKQCGEQLDLFIHADPKRKQANTAVDDVNRRYGEFTVCPAPLINRSGMPNVIAPAWKPTGHRETIG